jgi:hypothetical protein
MMMEVVYRGTLTVVPEYEGEEYDHDAIVEATFDEASDELFRLGYTDVCLSASITTGEIEISMIVETSSAVEASEMVASAIRSALHTAHVSTLDWPSTDTGFLTVAWTEVTEPDLVDA